MRAQREHASPGRHGVEPIRSISIHSLCCTGRSFDTPSFFVCYLFCSGGNGDAQFGGLVMRYLISVNIRMEAAALSALCADGKYHALI